MDVFKLLCIFTAALHCSSAQSGSRDFESGSGDLESGSGNGKFLSRKYMAKYYDSCLYRVVPLVSMCFRSDLYPECSYHSLNNPFQVSFLLWVQC